jgi:hypothetical protein
MSVLGGSPAWPLPCGLPEAGYAFSVSRPKRRGHIDLFDDPSWESPESQEEAAAYQRLAVSGFSAKTESTIAAVGVGLYFLWVGAIVLFFLTLNAAINAEWQIFAHDLMQWFR